MKIEVRLFFWLFIFFLLVAPVYGWWNGWTELAGPVALILTALMMLLVSFYLRMTARHYQDRPEDSPAIVSRGASRPPRLGDGSKPYGPSMDVLPPHPVGLP